MDAHDRLEKIFKLLQTRIQILNEELRDEGGLGIKRVKIEILGQMSLLANEKVASILTLAQTGDLYAKVSSVSYVEAELKKILSGEGLVLDSDSHLIWIPPKSHFESLFDFPELEVFILDAESALVSKAVKAPKKNKQLIQDAIAAGIFPKLVERILANGGKLEHFS